LAPQDLPYWFGMNPVGKLALGTIRYLGHENTHLEYGEPNQAPEPPPTAGRIRHGLIVYDGGQA